MEDDAMTQLTQNVMDPRRVGRNNSGLCAEDVSDVVCILHPCTPAAFRLVTETARRAPQHVLQGNNHHNSDIEGSPRLLEEQETFILHENAPNQGLDLAVRFSSRTVQPRFGFVFGRNKELCDVVVSTDAHKRVSNVHFTIFMNTSGVLMLRDMSTNGTMVDEVLLKGKGHSVTQTRMLNNGSIIQILSPTPEEILRFIVRIPSRDGFLDEHEAKFQAYIERMAEDEKRWFLDNPKAIVMGPKNGHIQNEARNTSVKAPIIRNQYGMHWNGGDVYNVVGHIGKGAFASVYQLATKRDGQLFAAKELEKRKFMKNGILDRKLENEMHIMQQIDHPNIVQYIDYQDQANHLYIIMEFVACGDLQQLISKNGHISEPLAKLMASQVFAALEYLHQKRITHRDIKPDNLLIADMDPKSFRVKLSDFGLSKVVKDNDTFLKTFCGTLLYCAPEVFPHYDSHVSSKGTKRPRKSGPQLPTRAHIYSSAVDIWSFGAVLWYALCQKPPFEGVADTTGRGMFDKIMTTPLDVSDLVEKDISQEAISLLVKMLNVNPAARPAPFHCIHDPWFGKQMPDSADIPDHIRPALMAIAEEAEAGAAPGEEPNFAALSLNEEPNSQQSEVSIDSADLNFFDPRQSKRFKPGDIYDEERNAMIHSSPELLYQSIPIIHGELDDHGSTTNAAPAKPPKLFGEISRSDLQKPIFGLRPDDGDEHQASSSGSEDLDVTRVSNQNAQPLQHPVTGASPSLLGAESMVREMQVDSTNLLESPVRGNGEPATPRTPPRNGALEAGLGLQSATDDTPKPASVPFSRQIDIFVPPSFYYDPADRKTHTVDHASRQSGHDYVAQPIRYMEKQDSLPRTLNPSSSKNNSNDSQSKPSMEVSAPALTPPAREGPKYGRLVSTPDSFAQITLDLNDRITKWGRDAENTHVYPNVHDTRVAKVGIVLCFHANGIEEVDARGEDWTQMPGLHCELLTHSSVGLFVNGIRLQKQTEKHKQPFGKIHSGDRIVAWPARDGKPSLAFTVELFYGEGKQGRAPYGAPFQVEIDELVESEGSDRDEDGSVKMIRHWAPSRKI